MRCQATFTLSAILIVLVITWGLFFNSYDVLAEPRKVLELINRNQIKTAMPPPRPKCSLSRVCPADHFAFHLRSGAAYLVGPKICFNGEIIMSHVLNNVGHGMNIVLVNGETGVIEKFGFLNMLHGNPEQILSYLKGITPGTIVLVASFNDVTTKMTDDMREIFVGLGSTLIKSLKHRDSWVFAGLAGSGRSLFEEKAVNDEKINLYEGWPHVVEVGGCLPRTQTDENKL